MLQIEYAPEVHSKVPGRYALNSNLLRSFGPGRDLTLNINITLNFPYELMKDTEYTTGFLFEYLSYLIRLEMN